MSYSAFEQALRHAAALVEFEAAPIGDETFYDQSTVLWNTKGASFVFCAQVTVLDIARNLSGPTVPLPCYLELRVPEADSLLKGASA